jgi:Uma2 family endonuclease
MTTPPKRYYTPEEYLALERAAGYKSEYLDGEIYPMNGPRRPRQAAGGSGGESYAGAGASLDHTTITLNIAGELRSLFRGGPCRVFALATCVTLDDDRLYTYPDVLVICGKIEIEDLHEDTITNPTAIFEVLSPSTERYDRGKKFNLYRQLESLQEYMLVAQDEVRVEQYTRQGDGWLLRVIQTLDDSLYLPSVEATLPLSAIYENVEVTEED